MKKDKSILLLLSAMLLLISCEDPIQIKLDEGSKTYVIDAFVNDLRKDQVIKVKTTYSYFSNQEAPGVVGAIVVLKDLTANKAYTFNHTSNGNYVYPIGLTDTIAKVNHQYELNITIDGFTYTSLTTQKRTAKVDTILSIPEESIGPPKTDTIYNCLLIARDKADNNPDYYWLRSFRNDSLIDEPNEVNICVDGTQGVVIDAATDSILFTPPSTFFNFKQFRKNAKVGIEIHSISKDNYYFFIQASAQINNGGLFATTPENVKTNIENPAGAKTKAIGRFNMATVATYSCFVK